MQLNIDFKRPDIRPQMDMFDKRREEILEDQQEFKTLQDHQKWLDEQVEAEVQQFHKDRQWQIAMDCFLPTW